MTADTPSAAAPARPARSLAGAAHPARQRRPGANTVCVARARARTGADPAVIHLVTHAALREAFAALPPADSEYCGVAEPGGEPGEGASKPIKLGPAGEPE
jgi:hypothetical protein